MRSEWIESFLALAACGNFSRAAEARNVTQSAFSRRIQALEYWAGAPLFDRFATGVSLTPSGTVFLRYAENALREIAGVRADVLEAAGRLDRPLAFAATHALSFTFFPNWIREYAPHEAINLVSENMESCERMMLHGDVAFLLHHSHPKLIGALNPRNFASLKVGEDTLVPLCLANADGRPMWPLESKSEAAAIPHLAYSSASGLGRILQADWTDRELHFNLTTAMTSVLAAALLTMVRQGHGLAWLPRSLVEADLDRGFLVDAGFGAFSTPVEITLTRPISPLDERSERFWLACENGGPTA